MHRIVVGMFSIRDCFQLRSLFQDMANSMPDSTGKNDECRNNFIYNLRA